MLTCMSSPALTASTARHDFQTSATVSAVIDLLLPQLGSSFGALEVEPDSGYPTTPQLALSVSRPSYQHPRCAPVTELGVQNRPSAGLLWAATISLGGSTHKVDYWCCRVSHFRARCHDLVVVG